jgi:hypothetical protein
LSPRSPDDCLANAAIAPPRCGELALLGLHQAALWIGRVGSNSSRTSGRIRREVRRLPHWNIALWIAGIVLMCIGLVVWDE